MTDYLIKTDGTSSGLTLGAAISDTDALEVQQAFVAPASTLHQTFAAIKTWIKAWIVKSDVGLGNVSNVQLDFGHLQTRFYSYTDCLGGTADFGWQVVNNGTGSTSSTVQVGSLNALGIISLDLGTTTTGRAGLSANGGSTPSVLKLGSGRGRFQSKCAIHTLSNGTDTYTVRVGFIENLGGESTDGAFFRYTDSVNSGKWQAVTRSNGVETATDTGITPVADAWHLMAIDVNAAGTSVVFSIDGSTVATITTNIPTGSGRETGFGLMAQKSAGTTATSGLYVDFAEVEVNFTTAR